MPTLAILLSLSTIFAVGQTKAPIVHGCQVRVLAPIKDDLGNTWKVGSILPVDIERDGANGGAFCAHAGSCLPQMVGTQPALTLLNCRVGTALGGGDFRLVPGGRRSGSVLKQGPSL